jgi:GH24 family phage-related lysozyme (muramidase)
MQISAAGLAFIQENEGFESHTYNDNGKQAIGYGHDLLPGESFPTGITEEQAVSLLDQDLALIEITLSGIVPPTCTQNQWDALCDFGYNDGVGALKMMLAHGWAQVPTQILRWDHDNKDGVEVVDPDLAARRAAEVKLFQTP